MGRSDWDDAQGVTRGGRQGPPDSDIPPNPAYNTHRPIKGGERKNRFGAFAGSVHHGSNDLLEDYDGP